MTPGAEVNFKSWRVGNGCPICNPGPAPEGAQRIVPASAVLGSTGRKGNSSITRPLYQATASSCGPPRDCCGPPRDCGTNGTNAPQSTERTFTPFATGALFC